MLTSAVIPTEVIGFLVADHINHVWSKWQDTEIGGCCTQCCGPCWALKWLKDQNLLDLYYGAYVEKTGPDNIWDDDLKQVDRKFLDEAWSADIGCHEQHEPA